MKGRVLVTDDELLTQMQAPRDKVTGITGTAVASRDGLIITADTGAWTRTTWPRWPPRR